MAIYTPALFKLWPLKLAVVVKSSLQKCRKRCLFVPSPKMFHFYLNRQSPGAANHRMAIQPIHLTSPPNQENLKQGKAQLALKNWKNLFGDQREDSLTSLEVCYLL